MDTVASCLGERGAEGSEVGGQLVQGRPLPPDLLLRADLMQHGQATPQPGHAPLPGLHTLLQLLEDRGKRERERQREEESEGVSDDRR